VAQAISKLPLPVPEGSGAAVDGDPDESGDDLHDVKKGRFRHGCD
jgi:hypothetical protein